MTGRVIEDANGTLTDHIGPDAGVVIHLLYSLCVQVMLTIAIGMLYLSVNMYVQVAFWMPDVTAKLWCITSARRIRMLLAWGQCWLLVAAVLTSLFGALLVLPLHHALTTLLPVAGTLGMVVWDLRRRRECTAYVHQQAERLLQIQHDAQASHQSGDLTECAPI